MAYLHISLFGTFQVTVRGRHAVPIESDKAQALLAYLALEGGQPHRRDSLAALFWPEANGQKARQSLRQSLYTLRRSFNSSMSPSPEAANSSLFETSRQHIRFSANGQHWLDVTAFTVLLDQCQTHPHQRLEECPHCAARLQCAADLYRGDLLAGLSLADCPDFEAWRLARQEELHTDAMHALHQLAAYYERRRDHERAAYVVQRELALEPWREEAHRQLIRVLALSGQRSAALAQYESCRRILAQELAVGPSAETVALPQLVLAGPMSERALADLEGKRDIEATNPYKGLRAFGERDTADFYGREAFVERLVRAVERPQADAGSVVALIGPSGSGKSSLVYAGLLPRLRMGGTWAVASLRPGAHPFRSLVGALAPLLPARNGSEQSPLAQALREGDRSLAEIVGQAPVLRLDLRRIGAGAERRLLIVVDALEELYTLCADPARRQDFLGCLLGLEADPRAPPPYTVLFTLRADFFGQALAYPGMAERLRQGCLILGPMRREELREAIEEPARARGVAYEAGLVARLLDGVGDEPGNLPLLQFTLAQLWAQQREGLLTHAAYDTLGGVAGALTGYAEDAYAGLDASERDAVRRVFTHMVRAGRHTEDARRPVLRSELDEREWGLVRKLADARLVVTGRDANGRETAEVVHEALIRTWGRLRGWLEADLAFHFWLQRLRTAVRQWEMSGQDEGALLRGALLGEAEEWIAGRANDLGDGQRAFIAASVALRDREQSEAEAQARALEQAVQLAQSLRLAANARLALRDNNTDLALALAWEANQVPSPPPESKSVLAEAAYAPGTRRLYRGHSSGVECLALSPDGRAVLSGSVDRTLILWHLETGQTLGLFRGHQDTVYGVAYHPGGHTALSASADHTLILWDLVTGQALRRFHGHRGAVHSVAFSPDGRTALSGSRDQTLILWDVAGGHVIRRFEGHRGAVLCVAFSPNGTTALSGAEDRSLILWDLARGATIHHMTGYDGYPPVSRPLKGHHGFVQDIAFTPDGDTALSVSEDQTAILWNLERGEVVRSHRVPDMTLYSTDVSRDGRRALLGTLSGSALLLDLQNGRVIQRMLGHHGRIVAVTLHPDGRSALSGAADGDLRLWNLCSGAEMRCTQYDEAAIAAMSVDLSPDEQRGLTGFYDGSLVLWDRASGAEIKRLAGHSESIYAGVRFRPDGKTAVSGSGDVLAQARDNTVRLWDLETGAEMHVYAGHSDRLWDLDLAPDGRHVLSAGHDGTVRLWDLGAGPEESTGRILLDLAPQAARSVAFGPDGRTALVGPAKGASSAPDYRLILLEVETGKELRRLAGYGEVVTSVSISPDGRLALSGALDGTIYLWDLESGELVRRLEGHSRSVLRVLFGPEGDVALSASRDKSVIVWDVASGKATRHLLGHQQEVTGICLAQGGKTVVSVGVDLTMREWRIDATQQELLDWIQANRYVPELTPEQRSQYRVDLIEDPEGF